MPKLCYLCDKPVLGDVPHDQKPISKKLAHVACLPEYILRPALVVIKPPRRGIEVRHLHFDKSVNRTFASVMAPGFHANMYVSGKISAKQFIEWVTPTVERMEAELETT